MTKPHYLRSSAKDWTPRVIVSLDTETTEFPDNDRLVHIIKCWVAKWRIRYDPDYRWPSVKVGQGTEPTQCCDLIEQATEIDNEVWVFAHNLGFDLSTTSLPFILSERGWTIRDVHLGEESCWWALARNGKRLVLTDSWSWLRCGLDDASKDVHKRKVPLPSNDDAMTTWFARCRKDVDILDAIMCQILDWWDANNLGRFGITGAGCGFTAMRAKIARRSILVGPDELRTPFERQALFGGRQEVYRVGEIKGAWSADYDLQSAYCNVALCYRLPTKHIRHLEQVDGQYLSSDVGPYDVIARCEITTTRPVAPCRIEHDIWWPTGTFQTVLTGPELRYVKSTGASVKLLEGELYRVDHTLSDWAYWCIGLINNRDNTVPPIIRRLAKGWSRSVVGRFAARTSQVLYERPATHLGWHLETGNVLSSGAHIDVLSMGGIERTIVRDVEPDDGFVAITAFVEGWCRAALGTILDSRPQHHLIQCNTDGWWEHSVIPAKSYVPETPLTGIPIVRKRLERVVTMLGANHLRTAKIEKLAGVSAEAESSDQITYNWHDWPGMRWQLENGTLGEFHRPPHTVELADSYVRRWVLANGETVPATACLTESGSNDLLPWSQTLGRRSTDVLARYQVPRLQALTDPSVAIPEHRAVVGLRLAGRFLPAEPEQRRARNSKTSSPAWRRLFPPVTEP